MISRSGFTFREKIERQTEGDAISLQTTATRENDIFSKNEYNVRSITVYQIIAVCIKNVD